MPPDVNSETFLHGKAYSMKIIGSGNIELLFKTDDQGRLLCYETSGFGIIKDYGKVSNGIAKTMLSYWDMKNGKGTLYLGDNNGDLKIINIEEGKIEKERLKLHGNGLFAMDLSKDAKKIFTTDFGNYLKVWE